MQFNHSQLQLKKRKITGSILIPLIATLLIQSLALFLFPSTSHADGGFPIIGVLHAGSRPEGIAVDTQTHLVYIAYEYPSLVIAFDPGSGKVRWQTTVGDTPTDVQVDSTNHHVYVASTLFRSRQDLLAVLDGATGKALLTAPTGLGDNGIAVDTKRQRVYVSSTDNPIINVFKLVTSPTGNLSAESSILAFGPRPQALGVNSRLGRLYVGDAIENTITVYDEDRGRKLAIIPVADVPEQPLRVDEATARVYVVCSVGQELDINTPCCFIYAQRLLWHIGNRDDRKFATPVFVIDGNGVFYCVPHIESSQAAIYAECLWPWSKGEY